MKKTAALLLIFLLFSLTSCGAAGTGAPGDYYAPWGDVQNGGALNGTFDFGAAEKGEAEAIPPALDAEEGGVENEGQNRPLLYENPYIDASKMPTSTFSADVDTVSYSLFRKYVEMGCTVERLRDYLRYYYLHTEEMVNYFDYDYVLPNENELFGVKTVIAPCPWNPEAKLLSIGLATEERVNTVANNLVFLIDVSGSMSSEYKLALIKKSFPHLVENLSERDRVSIVTYSGSASVVLEGAKGNETEKILAAVNRLEAGGSTAGEAGLLKAYQIAQQYYITGGNNRILLTSDGDFNVGIGTGEEMEEFIAKKRESGIYISVLAVGDIYGMNLSLMEAIAQNGNGVYYFLDGEAEAKKVFSEDLLATLYTVASDVKLQLTFDPAVVKAYRLVGYENRILANEDFEDDTKDAGEVGAGHTVTVFYELKMAEEIGSDSETGTGEAGAEAALAGEYITLAVRYKKPGESVSELCEYRFGRENETETPDGDFRFAAAVARVSLFLNESQYQKDDSLAKILADLEAIELQDPYKLAFRELVKALIRRQS